MFDDEEVLGRYWNREFRELGWQRPETKIPLFGDETYAKIEMMHNRVYWIAQACFVARNVFGIEKD